MEPLPDLTSALDHSPRRFVGLSKGARKLAVVGLSYQGRWVLVSKRRTMFLHSCLPSGLWGTHEWISNMFIISHPSLRTYLKFMAFMAARRWQPKFYFSYEHANGFTVSTGSQASYQKIMFRRFLITWADGLVPMRFAIFPVHLSEVLRLPRKSDARSYEELHLSRKIISANLKI